MSVVLRLWRNWKIRPAVRVNPSSSKISVGLLKKSNCVRCRKNCKGGGVALGHGGLVVVMICAV